jgi:hypothetical protein
VDVAKKERKKRLEKFKEERELQINLHKIIRIQAWIRGYLARTKKIPGLKTTEIAIREIRDQVRLLS